MNYENNSFGLDILIVILAKGEPYKDNTEGFGDELGEDFLQLMTAKEKETEYFLSTYYNMSIFQQYTNLDKICQVKELYQDEDGRSEVKFKYEYGDDDNESIIVKKYEDEDI